MKAKLYKTYKIYVTTQPVPLQQKSFPLQQTSKNHDLFSPRVVRGATRDGLGAMGCGWRPSSFQRSYKTLLS